jgi:hypothetical protein
VAVNAEVNVPAYLRDEGYAHDEGDRDVEAGSDGAVHHAQQQASKTSLAHRMKQRENDDNAAYGNKYQHARPNHAKEMLLNHGENVKKHNYDNNSSHGMHMEHGHGHEANVLFRS